jgi:hypothetical protein
VRTVYFCLISKIHSGFLVYLKILVLILKVDYVLDVAFFEWRLFVVFPNYFAKRTCSKHFRFYAVLVVVAGCNQVSIPEHCKALWHVVVTGVRANLVKLAH